MSILINKDTRVITQGITGTAGAFHTKGCLDYGTKMVGGTTPGSFVGGYFALPTNIGRQSRDDFTVVPELTLKVGCDILPGVHAFVGYDLLYWSQVVRPGSEVDRNINISQSTPISGGGTLVGPAAPLPLFNKTDFYANGITFGVELRF